MSDDELLEKARELAHNQTALTIITIHHLSEIERRRLYAKRGYPSLFEYAVRELYYSKAGAWRRIMTMKLCRGGTWNRSQAAQRRVESYDREPAPERDREAGAESVEGVGGGPAGGRDAGQ